MERRVLVIGLDGVGFQLIEPWIEGGKLPYLEHFLNEGIHGNLTSTVPPITGPAWSSFQTGVNPGKHGVFGWTKRQSDSYGISIINGDDLSYPTVWELASENGQRVVSIGVPVTYPPRPINGVIIPGMLTPRSDPSPTYPTQAYDELRRAAPDYCFFPDCAHRFTITAKVNELLRCVRGRAKAAQYFMHHQDWDLFMIHFQSTDTGQHSLWGVKKNGIDPLLTVFAEVDRLVGELVETAQRMGASVVLLSDHGMGPLEYTFSINTWLLESGYLQLRNGLSGQLKRLMFRLGFTQSRLMRFGLFLYPLAYRLGIANSIFDIKGNRGIARLSPALFLSLDDIDWSRTRAYSRADIGHIYLNLKGREPSGIVPAEEAAGVTDELIEKLKEVVNPHSGESLLGEVFRREEIYHGERLDQAPDILFLPKELRTVGNGGLGFFSNHPFDRPIMGAHHRMEGIVAALGEPFRPGHHIQGASLIDLPANLLYLLDCPIPNYMDGRIWAEAFLPGTLATQAPRFSERLHSRGGEARPSGDDEELKRRLKGLGYLS